MRIHGCLLILASIALLVTVPAKAPAYQLTASEDAFLDESRANTPLGCSPSPPTINIGYSGGTWRQRGVIRFPLGNLPSGTQVQSAVLRVWCMSNQVNGRTIHAFLAANQWPECTVTWNSQPGHWVVNEVSTIWNGVGYQCFDVTDLIRLSVENPGAYPNYGLKFYSEDNTEGYAQIATRELGDATRRPILYVNECPPLEAPTPSSPCAAELPAGTTDVDLQWTGVACADAYECEVFRAPDCSGSVWQNSQIGSTTVHISGLTEGDYSWHVRALNGSCQPAGASVWSTCCSFTVLAAQENCTQSIALDVAGATAEWTQAGMSVAEGEVLWIRASGRIGYSQVDESNPDGCRVTAAGADSCRCRFVAGSPSLGPNLVAYGLIGRIGDGVPFFVGQDLFIRCGTDGPLELAFNDDAYGDNWGSFQVQICRGPCSVDQSYTDGDEGPRVSTVSAGTPNPFRTVTRMSVYLPREETIRAEIVDVSGRRVATVAQGTYPAGVNEIQWDGRDARGAPMTPGVYFMRAAVGGKSASRRLILLR